MGFEVENIVRVHTPNCYIEVGTDPDTGTAVEIRTPDGNDYFGNVRLMLSDGHDSKGFALAIADAIRTVAETLK